jgi:ribonuclease HI
LALAVAERLAQRGDAAGVVRTLDFASRLESLTTEEWALMWMAARLLETNGAPAKAVETYRQLLAARELPRELRVAWLRDAGRAATAANDLAQSEAWDRELAELVAAKQP